MSRFHHNGLRSAWRLQHRRVRPDLTAHRACPFAFCNRERNKLKILYRAHNEFWRTQPRSPCTIQSIARRAIADFSNIALCCLHIAVSLDFVFAMVMNLATGIAYDIAQCLTERFSVPQEAQVALNPNGIRIVPHSDPLISPVPVHLFWLHQYNDRLIIELCQLPPPSIVEHHLKDFSDIRLPVAFKASLPFAIVHLLISDLDLLDDIYNEQKSSLIEKAAMERERVGSISLSGLEPQSSYVQNSNPLAPSIDILFVEVSRRGIQNIILEFCNSSIVWREYDRPLDISILAHDRLVEATVAFKADISHLFAQILRDKLISTMKKVSTKQPRLPFSRSGPENSA